MQVAKVIRGYRVIGTLPTFTLTGSTDLEITRSSPSYRNSYGEWIEGQRELITIKANVQPLGYRDSLLLPEPERTKAAIKIYSSEEIKGSREGAEASEADEVVWDGYVWKVVKVQVYQMGVLNHYKAIASRLRVSAK